MTSYLITSHVTRESRHDYIREQLQFWGINYQTIFSPHYEYLKHPVKQTSLTLAYYQIAQTAIFDGVENYIVFEDDVNLNPAFPDAIELLKYEMADLDLCYLTTTEKNRGAYKKPYSALLDRVISNWWETPVTLWTNKFARIFVAYAEWKISQGFIGNIDHELGKLNEGTTGWPEAPQDLKFYAIKHELAVGLSTVNKRFETSL